MGNSQNLKLNYALKIFKNSGEDKFLDALDIYRRTVTRNEKTNTNEITWCLDNSDKFDKFTLFLFGLELNNKIIGYAELALIKSTRYITIDYLLIDEKYKTHSALYTFLFLIVEFLSSIKLDYDFIGIELLTDDNGELSKEELSEFELEGFRVVNTQYIQPCLEINNYDSQHEALLLIYQRNTSNRIISKDTYLSIVHSIFIDYYFEWDSCFLKDEVQKNIHYNKLQKTYDKIKDSLTENSIILNGYPFTKMSNENKVIPDDKIINIKIWQGLLFTMVLASLGLGLILAVKRMNVELIFVVAIFVLLIFIWLSFISLFNDKAYTILSNIPILSKIFENKV